MEGRLKGTRETKGGKHCGEMKGRNMVSTVIMERSSNMTGGGGAVGENMEWSRYSKVGSGR